MTGMRRYLKEHRVTLWLCALTGVMLGTMLRIAIVIDDFKEEVRRSTVEDCTIRELFEVVTHANLETDAGRQLIADLHERLDQAIPETEC